MADALAKYRAALKKYRKENPGVAFRTAQKRVASEMKSGKVSGPKKKAAAKRKVAARPAKVAAPKTKRKRIAGPKKIASSKSIGKIDRGLAIVKEIDKLEAKRAALTRKELRDLVQLEINNLHLKLDRLSRPQAVRRR